ncbi:zinc finger protein 436-like [Acanthopagrus latus]|uniref:zinc finger protein 436-like n=1 Tax=Acanthopagrus latus TaxID=8177 RepID=UPI00187C5ED5|nr:zinc finger protein 436-like [Acanthopagrus latus]XP_036949767.1 zinc finger protein 436-like [Acanthopagrus latus]XP_036949768.1 zinc finger protein 436-like [Acanthopagrus latus]XP_036949769.1 zinc finger protein 436-like [Acanthopagrus latus]
MSEVQKLRAAAAETIHPPEEEEEQHELLDGVTEPEVPVHRAEFQHLLVIKEEVKWSSSLDQDDPPGLPHIKEEQEELWTRQEGEQLPGLEEADIIKFTFTPVPVKSEEDDEEEPQSSQLHQIKTEEFRDGEPWQTESDGEDCGGPEPARNFNPEFPQLLVIKEEVKWSSSLDQQDQPELPHIKEEQEELWTRQEGEQLPGLEEADIKFTFTPVPVKSEEDDEEKPQSSQLHQIKTEEIRDGERLNTKHDGEDCGGPEPAWNLSTDSNLQPADDGKTSHSSEPESDDSWDWEDTRKHRWQHDEAPIGDVDCNPGAISVIPSECAATSGHSEHRLEDDEIQTGVRPFGCLVCGKRYRWKNSLTDHNRLHAEEKPFSCSECKKSFQWKIHLVRHMRIHTGEKPFSCSVCGEKFAKKQLWRRHLAVHTGEKPYCCSVCRKRFTRKDSLRLHSVVHTGKKPFSCSVCRKEFTRKDSLRLHSAVHTGEKTFSCSVCGKGFAVKFNLRRHLKLHTGEAT